MRPCGAPEHSLLFAGRIDDSCNLSLQKKEKGGQSAALFKGIYGNPFATGKVPAVRRLKLCRRPPAVAGKRLLPVGTDMSGSQNGCGSNLQFRHEPVRQLPQTPGHLGDQCEGAGESGKEDSGCDQEQQEEERLHGQPPHGYKFIWSDQ